MKMAFIVGCALLAAPSVGAKPADWVDRNKSAILSEYVQLLAIPNVASDLPNIRLNAEHITAMMAKRGLSPRLLEGDSASVPPAIYGEWRVPGAKRTFVIYAHYDGQPVTPEDWKSGAPFTPVLRSGRVDKDGQILPLPTSNEGIDPDWRIYARSASDDKLGVMAVLAAVDALKAEGKTPSFNLKIFFEGEEEAGSPNLAAILAKHRDTLASDGWVIIDGPSHPSGAQQAVLGVRGDVNLDLIVHGAVRPLHSGHYGNWAPNPALMLSRLLGSMKDPSGRVTIAGFYDDVEPLSARERQALAAVPAADAQLRQELGLAWTEGSGRPLLDLLTEPSLNINGIRSAEVGERARNVVPPTASATLDLRLVKGNDHVRQVDKVIRHIEEQGYTVLEREPTMEERRSLPRIVTIKRGVGYNAERTSIDDPLVQGVIGAMKGNGNTVVLPSLGGSLPLYIFRETLGAPTVTVSLANHDNNQHGADENLRLGSLWAAIPAVAAIMRMK